MGLLSSEDRDRLCSVRGLTRRIEPHGDIPTEAEVGAALDVTLRGVPRAATVRDRAVVAVLAQTGLRRSELAALDLSDQDLASDEPSLTVRQAKRDGFRWLPLPPPAVERLLAWVALRGEADGPLFCGVSQRGQLTYPCLSHEGVAFILKRALAHAGARPLSPHAFRRYFVSTLLSARVDPLTIQRLAGHASLATTAGCDGRGRGARHDAVLRGLARRSRGRVAGPRGGLRGLHPAGFAGPHCHDPLSCTERVGAASTVLGRSASAVRLPEALLPFARSTRNVPLREIQTVLSCDRTTVRTAKSLWLAVTKPRGYVPGLLKWGSAMYI